MQIYANFLQADDSLLASDGCVVNFLSVMYELASKVTMDKINPAYPFHPQTRVRIDQEARLCLRPEDLKQFVAQIGRKY